MFNNRKDLDELEAKVDFVVDGQLKLQEKLAPLQADIERSLGEQLNLAQVALNQDLEKQRAWLKQTLETIWNGLLNCTPRVSARANNSLN